MKSARKQFDLGVAYGTGRGVPEDQAEAARWYRLAADRGHAAAQFYLGVRHEKGIGVPQDLSEAARLYRLAGERHSSLFPEKTSASAQLSLGLLYYEGRGVPQDYPQAYLWFRFASANRSAKGTNMLRATVAKMTPVQIAEAELLWDKTRRRLVRSDKLRVYFGIGFCLQTLVGVVVYSRLRFFPGTNDPGSPISVGLIAAGICWLIPLGFVATDALVNLTKKSEAAGALASLLGRIGVFIFQAVVLYILFSLSRSCGR